MAQNTGEAVGLCSRNRIEEASDWLGTVAARDKTRFGGVTRRAHLTVIRLHSADRPPACSSAPL